jgi:hypothetical protein
MARLKSDGKTQVEGSVKMWLPLEPEEGERLSANSSKEILPQEVWLHVAQENGYWVLGTAVVKGRLYRKDGKVGERWTDVIFVGPHDDGEFEGPEWLRDLVAREVPRRLSGWTSDDGTNQRGAVPSASEAVSSVEISRRVRRSVQRQRFEEALSVLLHRENLDGTEWAIEWFITQADSLPDRLPESAITEGVKLLAHKLSAELDKRSVELAMRATEEI